VKIAKNRDHNIEPWALDALCPGAATYDRSIGSFTRPKVSKTCDSYDVIAEDSYDAKAEERSQ
jgi:hypothetical protein